MSQIFCLVSASGITQKLVTRRHISKRTPHTDTTHISTTSHDGGGHTLLSVTNNTDTPTTSATDPDSSAADISAVAAGPSTEDSGNTTHHSIGTTTTKDSGRTTHHSAGTTTAKDSGNTSHHSAGTTTAKDSGNTTHHSAGTTTAKDSGNTSHHSAGTTTAKDSGNTSHHSAGTTTAKDSGNTTHHSGGTTTAKDSGNTSHHSAGTTTAKDSGNTSHHSAGTTTAKDSGNTSHHSAGTTTAEDSGNTTQGTASTTQDSGNSTETSGIDKTDSEPSASVTYPLQTPSYLMTTYPSPTSHHFSESSAPFTSVPVTAPNTTIDGRGTEAPPSESTFVSTPPSTNSSLSTFPGSSSESPSSPSEVPGTVPNQSSYDVSSSSPVPSTFSTFPSEASPNFTSTKSSVPQTGLPTTPNLLPMSSSPSVPPSLPTTSDENIATSTFSRTSSPPTRADQTSGAYNSPTTVLKESSTTETDWRFLDGTTAALNVTTWRPVVETQTPETSLEDGETQSIVTTTHVTQPPAQPTHLIPLTTSRNLPIPLPRFTTQQSPQGVPETTSPGGPSLTTGGPSKQVTTIRTTSADIKTVMPKVETTISNKEKKLPARTTAQPGVVTAKPSTTTSTSPPTPRHPTPPSPTLPAPVSVCSPNPCHNGGSCTQRGGHRNGYKCECPAAWQGQHCDTDVDECLSRPCPAQATCVNLRGSFTCRCPLGYMMEKGASCVQVRTFLGHIEIPRSFLNGSNGKYTKLQQIEEEIVQILNSSFSVIGGYYQSSVTNSSFSNRIELSVRNIFLLSSNVTLHELRHNLQRYKKECQTSTERSASCRLILHPQLYYIAVSLCNMKDPGCDNETAECADPSGVARCQCKAGYFKYSTTDRSCRACDDGYKLQDGACVRCPFGLGGFNCSNRKSPDDPGCRKKKHDMSKLIFRSGDLQMSPYAEYPKSQRSAEWGRETIEMQENGSTKNLLQMTDVYYPPGLRSAELERNGLYPFSGLPGSRHSCIYPGQYNPTFINEENRRRDYF
ncbi:PREDICTED: protein HEG homolog 1 [Nanorana parkeri]|uniref:protein HEG homolog 1 n=1 Tax=Nanorana parkeri TaxID=125878 RepID=UPI000854DF61|nr:PREDICTED: protein HEG homolog 1 [Nanorana parkeri]